MRLLARCHLDVGRELPPFDYRPGFKTLKKAGFCGWLTVESGASDNPDAALERALKYVRRQWQEA